jgi:D-alanyl-D-alanine carboxypeptidase (penicillin-binding protein 5/6)
MTPPWLAAAVVALLLVASVAFGVAPAGAAPPSPTTTAAPPAPKAFVLVDADTGNVIDAGNDRTALPPASLTKVITALAASSLPPDTGVTVSDRAAAAPADKMSLKSGQVWTADELFHALLLASANDAAISLAEQVGGTVEGFQPVFARTALGLGMADNPVLMDPAGLDGPDGVEGGNLVSARDLAIAGRALLQVPYLAAIVATPVYYFQGPDNVRHRLTNHNKLFLTTYAGAVGIKTGYTKRAGACLMAAARVGGRTMLAVVLASANPTATAAGLLDKGFATPVAAESTTDQLPAVSAPGPLAAAHPPVSAGSTGASGTPSSGATSSASPQVGATSRPSLPVGGAATLAGASSPRSSWVSTAAPAAVLLGIVLTLAGQRRRRHIRRRHHPNL